MCWYNYDDIWGYFIHFPCAWWTLIRMDENSIFLLRHLLKYQNILLEKRKKNIFWSLRLEVFIENLEIIIHPLPEKKKLWRYSPHKVEYGRTQWLLGDDFWFLIVTIISMYITCEILVLKLYSLGYGMNWSITDNYTSLSTVNIINVFNYLLELSLHKILLEIQFHFKYRLGSERFKRVKPVIKTLFYYVDCMGIWRGRFVLHLDCMGLDGQQCACVLFWMFFSSAINDGHFLISWT